MAAQAEWDRTLNPSWVSDTELICQRHRAGHADNHRSVVGDVSPSFVSKTILPCYRICISWPVDRRSRH
jgi:hypothetical protein